MVTVMIDQDEGQDRQSLRAVS